MATAQGRAIVGRRGAGAAGAGSRGDRAPDRRRLSAVASRRLRGQPRAAELLRYSLSLRGPVRLLGRSRTLAQSCAGAACEPDRGTIGGPRIGAWHAPVDLDAKPHAHTLAGGHA